MTADTSDARASAKRQAGMLLAVLTILVLQPATAGLSQSWGTEVRSKPGAGEIDAQKAEPAPKAFAPNTTVIMKQAPTGGGADRQKSPSLTLQAVLTEGGARIEQGLVWRIYEAKMTDGAHRLISTQKQVAPLPRLPPGDYMINVAFGRAHLTRKVAVKAGEQQVETFVLNAGGLRVSALLSTGEAAPERSAFFDIYSDERDQFGNRAKVMTGVKAGLIVRLNAGIYHIVSTYGDANATERADVTVEAGKLTEATVRHSAARITLKLVTRIGGEAQADTRWSLLSSDGQVVKESLGALPTHILQAGTYRAVARQGGASYSQEFTVAAGEVKQIEVVMK